MTRIIWFGCFVIITVACITLYFDDKDNSAPTVTIAVPRTPLSAPLYIADKLSLFDSQCIKTNLIDVDGGVASFEAMQNHNADFSLSSDSVIVYQKSIKPNFETFGSIVQSDNDVKLLLKINKDLTQATTANKYRIAIIKNSASEYFLSLYLAYLGINQKAIELIAMRPEEIQSAFEQNIIDGASIWEPYAYEIQAEYKQLITVVESKSLYSLSFNLIGLKANNLASQQSTYCLMDGINQAIEVIANQPVKSQLIVQNRLNLHADFIKWVWRDYWFKLSLGESFLMNLNNLEAWRQKIHNVSEQPILFNNVINPQVMMSIKPESVSIHLKKEREF